MSSDLGNDAGLLAIGARFSVAAGFGAGQGAGEAVAALAPARPANPVRQVPMLPSSVPLSGGAGQLAGPIGTLGPPGGWYWSVRRMTAQGFTGGTVTCYDTSAAGEPVMTFAAAAVQVFARGAVLLHPQSYLVIAATGIVGQVNVFGWADAFPAWYLSEYLG